LEATKATSFVNQLFLTKAIFPLKMAFLGFKTPIFGKILYKGMQRGTLMQNVLYCGIAILFLL
jgi:hypothetical protein